MASTPTPLPVQSTALAVSAQGSMKGTAKKFIGAVEDEWQLFSDCASDYTIGAPIGFGASSIVYGATYHPSSPTGRGMNETLKGIPCALKVLDLDSLPPRSLQLLQRETTLMSLSKHPNVLRVRGSWMEGHKLYIALRLMRKGSAADVMRYGWPGGMEEDVVRCILRQALKGLNYLHINGFIHRDVKAANLLIDDDGTVLLGDLGVAANLAEDTSQIGSTSQSAKTYSVASSAIVSAPKTPLGTANTPSKRSIVFDGSSPQTPKPKMGKRKSFVGTPCWMSPELIQGKQYDSSSDIWSFGITALELTQGRPPRSRESPQRVLLRTIQDDPPTLDREGGVYKYSRAFKDVVDSCLAKDPSKRPTAEELLQTPFFKAAKKKSYLINTILRDLPPLAQRQERRVIPPVLSASSIDSWDFATTINSPTTSVYRRRVLEDFVSAEDEALQASGGVFEMEEDRHSISTRHSRIASWTGNPEVPVINETDAEQEIHSLSSTATSESSLLNPSFAPSEQSTPPVTSVPSSFTAPLDIIHKSEGTDSREQAEPNPTLIGLESVLPESESAFTRGHHHNASTAPTLWHTIKANVKRPSSRHDPFGDTSEGSPRKDKETGRMNGLFSGGASKGLFSRGSSRSPAATPSPLFSNPSTEPAY